jgi:hypothetical protein
MEDHSEPFDAVEVQEAPTENVPKYISEGLEKQDAESLVDIIGYALSLLDEARAPLDETELREARSNVESVEPVEESPQNPEAFETAQASADGNVWGITRKIMCNKSNCACHTNGELHGPYRYYAYRVDGSLKWTYLGKA